MSEDTPVNTGVTNWPGERLAHNVVRSMQTKLHDWAVRNPDRRFDDLYNLVYDPSFLTEAWIRVCGNKGAKTAGIDHVSVMHIEDTIGHRQYLEQVHDQVKTGTFTPVPVKQVMIPKKNGKMRALGIPVVTDRIVQAALKLVLEPIFEADFQPCSYGFRPNRRAQDAISEIHHYTSQSYQWILEGDIKACFDNIDHTALMDRIRARIKDKRILKLIKAFLKAGVLTTLGDTQPTTRGTPQGGIISPLLANIALSVLDDHYMTQWHQQMGTPTARAKRVYHHLANWRLIRYADDFVILIHGQQTDAEHLKQETAEVIAPMGLDLSPEKTRVVHIDEGFDFLGFNIRRMRKPGTHKSYIYTRPSKAAVHSIIQRIKASTYRSTRHFDTGYLIEYLSMVLRGWANYFRYGVSKAIFNKIDHYAWQRITHWILQKHHIGWPELKRRFCVPGTWLLSYDGHRFRGASSIPVTRYRYRGYNIYNPWNQPPSTTNS